MLAAMPCWVKLRADPEDHVGFAEEVAARARSYDRRRSRARAGGPRGRRSCPPSSSSPAPAAARPARPARRWPRRRARPGRRWITGRRASQQHPGGGLDVARFAGRAVGLHRACSSTMAPATSSVTHVGRDLDHHRARPAHLQQVEGAAHDVGTTCSGRLSGLDRLGDGRVGAGRAEQREDLRPVARMARAAGAASGSSRSRRWRRPGRRSPRPGPYCMAKTPAACRS